jgi:hypothetical protein
LQDVVIVDDFHMVTASHICWIDAGFERIMAGVLSTMRFLTTLVLLWLPANHVQHELVCVHLAAVHFC